MSFDLSSLRETARGRAAARMRRILYVLSLGSLAFAAAVAVASVLGLAATRGSLVEVVFVAGVFCAIGVMAWYTARMGRPDALNVNITDTGIEFNFPHNRRFFKDWRASGFRLELLIWPPTVKPRGTEPETVLVLGPRASTHLTPEAYRTLITKARSLGLAVTEGLPAYPPASKTVISAPARTNQST